MEIEIGGKKKRHVFWVADSGPNCILGLDFLRQHDCVIYASRDQVLIKDTRKDEIKPNNANDEIGADEVCCRIVASETILVPAQSEMLIFVTVKDFQETIAEEVKMMNPSNSLFGKKGALVATCVVDVGQGVVPVRLANLSDTPVTGYRDTTVGVCEGVGEVSSGSGGDVATKDLHKGTELFPEHLEKLFGTCMEELDNTQKDELEEKIRVTNAQARRNLKMAADRQSFRVNCKALEETFEKGDLVVVHSPAVKKGTTSKLHRPWQGPGLLLKRINDVLFRVTMGPQKNPKLIHYNWLRPYEGEELSWVKPFLEKSSNNAKKYSEEIRGPNPEDLCQRSCESEGKRGADRRGNERNHRDMVLVKF
ncbi:hypothetical protein HOLleu_24483 [Holothuria leucospilota]|uniref:Uncharacterized protein n=1 Tax=Holothuria leucospilota TaxID=206669 RepID=A0A9Q1BWB1_HOLLE|nr:hypothetical protein HOLleu_24483 [Holothuria leucospilota]